MFFRTAIAGCRPLDPNNNFTPMLGAQWRDNDGETIYGDYCVNATGELEQGTQYLAGVGYRDPADGQVRYSHGDQIGSTRAISGPQAVVTTSLFVFRRQNRQSLIASVGKKSLQLILFVVLRKTKIILGPIFAKI